VTKKVVDFFASLLGLVILSPIVATVAWQIRNKLGSPVFFRQIRPGKDGQSFERVKFRTMRDAVDVDGNALPDSERMTPFGKFLRASSLDELPALWNVLKGDMSLVGPRPCLLNQKKLISERKKRKVFKVKPGITGLAQISKITMKTPTLLAKTDLKMINQMNLLNYFYYVFKTLMLIIKKT
jgi:lipopolysaccharide/colanic/teichoic acid biosynthesis glycosyltransferase